MINQAGKYSAHATACAIQESKTGSLMATHMFAIDGTSETIRNNTVLAKADGTLLTKNIQRLREWTGWDGVDPFWLMEHIGDYAGVQVELEIEMAPGFADQTKLYPQVKWINLPGRTDAQIVSADKAKVLAKFGAKFRANASASPAVPKPVAAPVAAPAAPAPAAAPVQKNSSSMEECWQLLLSKTGTLEQTQRETIWFGVVDKIGKTQDAMDSRDWLDVYRMIENNYRDNALGL